MNLFRDYRAKRATTFRRPKRVLLTLKNAYFTRAGALACKLALTDTGKIRQCIFNKQIVGKGASKTRGSPRIFTTTIQFVPRTSITWPPRFIDSNYLSDKNTTFDNLQCIQRLGENDTSVIFDKCCHWEFSGTCPSFEKFFINFLNVIFTNVYFESFHIHWILIGNVTQPKKVVKM